jgi:hypothetical protein
MAQPVNNACASATPIGEGTVNGTTAGATNDGPATCGSSSTAADVWYLYTAPQDGVLRVSTCGSALNTVLSLWDGCPAAAGAELACNDNCCILQSTVTRFVAAGEQYRIRVSGFNGASGAFTLQAGTTPFVHGPDVVYSNIISVAHYGPQDGIHAYSLSSNTCNVGDVDLAWGPTTPLLATNAYRLKDGRLEQVGLSWVKNGTSAIAGSGCGLPCNGANGCLLGSGCQDAYTANLNGNQTILGPRSAVNAYTGAYPGTNGENGDVLFKRLQVRQDDLDDAGALYFVEGQYVAWDDALTGNAMNNASYRRVTVSGAFAMSVADVIHTSLPAIYAWSEYGLGVNAPDPSVQVVAADVPGEGRFHVAAKVSDLGQGLYRYDYAVRNFNSHRGAGSFSVPLAPGALARAIGFHDVDHHSGEPYDGQDWAATVDGGAITWSCAQTFAQNPDANAIRFATMYNFWFETDRPPAPGAATIGLFMPGEPASIEAMVAVPAPPCLADVTGDGTVSVADLTSVILSWGSCPGCPADIDGDGAVTVADLIEVLLAWGPC